LTKLSFVARGQSSVVVFSLEEYHFCKKKLIINTASKGLPPDQRQNTPTESGVLWIGLTRIFDVACLANSNEAPATSRIGRDKIRIRWENFFWIHNICVITDQCAFRLLHHMVN
jgi:hypothetical protein